MPRPKRGGQKPDPAAEQFALAQQALRAHPLFAPLIWSAHIRRVDDGLCPPDGWAVVNDAGTIFAHPTRRADAQQWVYVLAHCLLHLGFEQFTAKEQPLAWNLACDVMVDRFLRPLKFGVPPEGFLAPLDAPGSSEEALYNHFCRRGVGVYWGDMRFGGAVSWSPPRWASAFGEGLVAAVSSAVEVASGQSATLGGPSTRSPAAEARRWFINSYPLLGALAAAFTLVEDPRRCQQLGISVAAVDIPAGIIYLNPAAGLDAEGCRFVIAHELLHVGLRHDVRCQGRDPYLWNVACDYVINGWLVELGVGRIPAIGCLYDPSLAGESAEAIYDRIVTDMRRFRRLATLRGVGLSDILEPPDPAWWTRADSADLDSFYRQCLDQGLDYHLASGRGFLPAGLEEEIRALSQPPIPWDVALARWFDHYFAPLEQRRTYARPSRRQAATPDIPRPRVVTDPAQRDARTFGVILDTSGSMQRELLGKALGAIASYAMSHDVPAARVVFCDAVAYDAGYLSVEAIAGQVRVKGGGGTVLQPGIDLLEGAADFPRDGPLLIITDGQCDRLQIRRDHAFLLPQGRPLPFVPRGPVFRIV
jgi:predicted metal-dependent peptidase